jgi:hypothetical protein
MKRLTLHRIASSLHRFIASSAQLSMDHTFLQSPGSALKKTMYRGGEMSPL